MEVPVINRIRDFEVGINSINDPSFLSRSVAVSGFGKLHQAYGFWKWGALIIAFLAYFTNFVARIKSLVSRLRKIDVSITSPTLFDDFDSDSDISCSSSLASSDDEDEEDEEDEDEEEDVDSIYNRGMVNGGFRVKGSDYYNEGQNGNFTCFGGSFGDLFSWPDLAGIGSSGVVKLWDHLDIDGDGDGDDDSRNVVSSFLRNCGSSSSSFFLTAEKKGTDGVKVEACDPRAGFRMPALLAEWKQPGRLLGNIIGVDVGGVEKIYVRDDVSGKIAVGDLRRFNGALTESDGETWWDADVVIGGDGFVDERR
ncbi:hypothetical protein EUTSA_v10018918mg [Eutrema salsugineum]|uniref:Uncharacterized protein n=1 Tax=Eutrema salsugineum TaxID=72664 RepID=V4MB54_EUTSA|nr:uncharacterized protein LOC18009099 [Eutrema salsugineum]ESQ28426.1 hypothetical protein EUTSA_v10018918mg [Eutrema salsugineum]